MQFRYHVCVNTNETRHHSVQIDADGVDTMNGVLRFYKFEDSIGDCHMPGRTVEVLSPHYWMSYTVEKLEKPKPRISTDPRSATDGLIGPTLEELIDRT